MLDHRNRKTEQVVSYYGQLAPSYDRLGPRVMALEGRQLVELMQLRPAARVLDVATGRGAVLLPAAERVGPDGYVIGIDLAPEMVEATGEEIRQLGLQNGEVRVMDAEALDFPDGLFDYVLCGYGLFFFPHLRRALAEFYRVLKPGGRFGATTDGKSDERWAWLTALLEAYRAEPHPLVQALDNPRTLVVLLGEIGFTGIEVIERQNEIVYASPEEWWASRQGEFAARLAPDVLPRFEAESLARLAALTRADGLRRLSGVRFNLATKPAPPD